MPRSDDQGGNKTWNLESFLDSLVVELDKAQNTLALKAVNRKLTYTVKDVALDLQIFPAYDGDVVRFRTAGPGQQGASKLSIQLGSITDALIREVTRPPEDDDLPLDAVDIDPETTSTLKKMGIHTTKDLERVQRRKIDVGKVAGKPLDYSSLAERINQARRRTSVPSVKAVSLALAEAAPAVTLVVTGEHLAPITRIEGFPIAALDEQPVPVLSARPGELRLAVAAERLRGGPHELKVALDPFAVVRLTVGASAGPRDQHSNHEDDHAERQTA